MLVLLAAIDLAHITMSVLGFLIGFLAAYVAVMKGNR